MWSSLQQEHQRLFASSVLLPPARVCGLLLLVVESQVLEVKRSVLGTGVFMLAAPVNANIPSTPSRSPEGTTQLKKKKKSIYDNK